MLDITKILESIFSNPVLCLEAGILTGLPLGFIIACIIFMMEDHND
jgi:hypothetical protein